MSMRYKGSRLSATANTPTSLTASGAWTLQQQMQANGTSTWPFVRDPQFNYVTMLLYGDGSAGANNGSGGGATPTVTAFNTDASTNNFNVTINGDARSNNFNPYQAGYYSNYFDGTGDYLSLASNSALQFGTGDFTFECWVYRSSASGQIFIADFGASSASGWGLYDEGSGGNMQFRIGDVDRIAVSPLNAGVWNHVAVVRSGTTATLYVNGASAGSYGSASTNLTYSGTNYIGSQSGSSSYINGYMSNVRAVKGTAVYTSNFTPSTTPLTAITNTSLLTCQSNRFIDNSANAFTVTANGNTAVAPAQPFTLPSSVATYGSGYFDGTGDYLTAPDNTAFNLSGDFTVEAWVNVNNTSAEYCVFHNSTDNLNGVALTINSGAPRMLAGNGSWYVAITSSIATPANTWNHVAYTRSGNTYTIWVNGQSGGSTVTATSPTYSGGAQIGRLTSGVPIAFPGYISNMRVVKGTAVYTTTFTPPTSPLTAVSGTSLLTTQYNGGGNNSGFKDSSLNNFAITRNGNTTQGTFAPYGSNWGNYFGATGQYLSIPYSSAFNLTGDFTIEFWINPGNLPSTTGTAAQSYERIFSFGTYNAANSLGLEINSNDSGNVRKLLSWYNASSNVVSANNAVSPGVWYHVAMVRSGTTITTYINGTSTGLTITGASAAVNTSQSFYIASLQGFEGDSSAAYNGYISNFRIVKGTAVYTSNFTPSTTPLTAISGTSLLTCQSNRFIDSSSNAATVTVTGSPSVQRFSPFANATAYNPATLGGSAYFDGSGDYLVTSGTGGFNPRSTFTVDFWTYPISNNTITWINSNTNNSFYFETSGTTLYVGDGLNNTIGTSAPTVNQWTHLLLSFDGTTYRLFYNGVLQASSTTLLQSAVITAFRIGQKQDGTRPFYGYITDMRVFVGTALYTAAFTPPTAPVTPTANTTLLLSTTNSAILDQSMMNDLETVGNAQISTSVVKYGTASIAFDGTGDYLRPNSQLPFVFNTGDFTIEFWVYANSVSGWLTFFDNRPSTTGSGFFLGYNSGFQYYSGSSNLISGGTLSTSTWTHVALCRASGNVRIFVNGTQVGSTATDTSNYNTSTVLANGPFIGSNYVPSDFLNGYLDDFRVTKYARYTATFTPPTQALPNG